ncbi:MAG: hypothetical protein HY540_03610 [Deltaproteobacteria bacterium]|nr:hypothetical protein [Deltaproteobacteria bacterium]
MKKWLLMVMLVLVPAMASATEVKYGNGFQIINDDETFKLKVTGRFQPRFEYTRKETGVRNVGTFKVRRADVNFKATIHKILSLGLGLKHSTNSKNFSTLNIAGGTMTYQAYPEFGVTVGMVGLPLDILTETSSSWYLLPEPGITATQSDDATPFTTTRDSFSVPDGLGVNIAGDISKFFYSLSVVNGAESNYAPNPGMKFSTGARMGVNILGAVGGSMSDFEQSSDPQLTVSIGGMYQGRRTDDAFATARNEAMGVSNSVAPDLKYIATGSGGVALRYAGFALTSEAYFRNTKFSSFGNIPVQLQRSSLSDFGYYAALGYYLLPKMLEAALQAGQIFRQGPDNNANQIGGGLNWYIFDNNLKIQLAYTWTQDYDDIVGTANNNVHNVVLQVHTMF